MRNKNIIIRTNGEETGKVSKKDVHSIIDEYSPYLHSSTATFYKDKEEMLENLNTMSLKTFIEFLTRIYNKFGDIPVLYFSGETGTFRSPCFNDIDIMKKYFTISGNTEETYLNIEEKPALSLFTF